MLGCIFTGHCIEQTCDKACPKFVQTSYLLERNNIDVKNSVFQSSLSMVQTCEYLLAFFDGIIGSVELKHIKNCKLETYQFADLLTYCAICQHWYGSRLSCKVFNLRFGKYIDDTKRSWNTKEESEELQYSRIWADTSKVLIISGLDYTVFKDFEAQTLLSLLQSRIGQDKTTILVTSDVDKLLGESAFMSSVRNLLKARKVKYDSINRTSSNF